VADCCVGLWRRRNYFDSHVRPEIYLDTLTESVYSETETVVLRP